MSINAYCIGALVRIDATFTDSDGVAAVPDTVTLKLRSPNGTITTYTDAEISSNSPADGGYYIDVEATAAGRYFYRWESTGDGQGASEGEFMVLDSRFS